MRKFTFEIGDIYEDYEIISSESKIKNGHTHVLVKCKCGKQEWKSLSDLKKGRTHSCRNCAARKRTKCLKIGDTSKNWTVIDGPIVKNYSVLYKVQCKCGNSRWMTPTEFFNQEKAFMCMKCASKIKKAKLLVKNGMVGELTQTKYSKIQRATKARDINFNVSKEELWNKFVAQNRKCALTGDDILDINKASLDRIDSNGEYTIDNVQWVTKQANLSKHTMTTSELIEFCKKVMNHANQQPSQPLTKLEGSETNS